MANEFTRLDFMLKRFVKSVTNKLGCELTRKPISNRPSRVQNELNRLKTLQAGVPTITTILGRPLQISCPRTFGYLYTEIYERGIYQIGSCEQSNMLVDGGANVGLATLFFKRQFPTAKVIAIEADPAICAMLRENLDTFGYSDVEVINAALASTRGIVSFAVDPGGTGGHIQENAGIEVPSITLSDILTEPVSLLKLDIEGAEIEVVHEAKHRLHHVENLFVEYHSFVGRKQALSELMQIIESHGFRCILESGGIIPRQPFVSSEQHKGYDNLVNIFALRQSLVK